MAQVHWVVFRVTLRFTSHWLQFLHEVIEPVDMCVLIRHVCCWLLCPYLLHMSLPTDLMSPTLRAIAADTLDAQVHVQLPFPEQTKQVAMSTTTRLQIENSYQVRRLRQLDVQVAAKLCLRCLNA